MIQVHSCNLLYSSIVMTDGLFERSVCYDSLFLKKMVYLILSVNCFIGFFSLPFCLFPNLLSFNTIYACKYDPSISPFLGSMYNCCTSCLYFSISKIFMHVPGIFTVTLQAISIPPWAFPFPTLHTLIAKRSNGLWVSKKHSRIWSFWGIQNLL